MVRVGMLEDDTTVVDLTPSGVLSLAEILDAEEPGAVLRRALHPLLPRLPIHTIRLRAPVEDQEVWAAGVTYLRSKTARMDESEFSANAYDRVYAAGRPELFFKSVAAKVAGPGESINIRADSLWSVPEPELALVLNCRGETVGCTIGNDVSSRDIEGENLLYLPQAKVYNRSCALGPWIRLGVAEAEARQWSVRVTVVRDEQKIFEGETSVGQLKRRFTELTSYLRRSQNFPGGAVLLTGTGIVPPDSFALEGGDVVEIRIPSLGTLRNTVKVAS